MRVRVEVCATSIAEALVAERAGADTVEVCAWLACGGITPSYGMVNTLKELSKMPMRVLIRPTPGGFLYDDPERQIILRDSMLIGLSHVGLVVGALDHDALPDQMLMKAIRLAAPDNEITFHRAIDQASAPLAAIDVCVQLGVERVLTSGGSMLAMDSLEVLKTMVERAGERLLIAAAGGINAENVVQLVESTGVREVHFSAQRSVTRDDGMGFDVLPDEKKIEEVMNALVKAGLR